MNNYEVAYNALVKGDLSSFLTIVDQDKTMLSDDDGIVFLHGAARHGRLQLVQEITTRGVDVNSMITPPDPEGAVVSAADSGHLEVTRWMLDQGALVNYVVGGKTRCFALTGAVVGGYLDVVKLLVERGADVNATGGRTTPLGYAVGFNQPAIADYLRSVGAKLPDELPK